jgi:hypothetical protein
MNAIRLDTEGSIARITLNRPDAGNAIDPVLASDLAGAATGIAADPTVRCVVLTGAGRLFCAGGDVGGMAAAGDEAPGFLQSLADTLHGAVMTVATMPKPLVVMVNGPAEPGSARRCRYRRAFGAFHCRLYRPRPDAGWGHELAPAARGRPSSRPADDPDQSAGGGRGGRTHRSRHAHRRRWNASRDDGRHRTRSLGSTDRRDRCGTFASPRRRDLLASRTPQSRGRDDRSRRRASRIPGRRLAFLARRKPDVQGA